METLQDINSKKQHVVDFFSALEFNSDEHLYKHNKRQLKSVSSVIKNHVEPFDADRIAGYVAKSRTKKEGRLVTKQDILDEWEAKKNAACNKGNRVHNFGETFQSRGLKPQDGYEDAVVAFWDSIPNHIYPFLFELKMFSLEKGIAGTADIILYNSKTSKFIIADYKTNIDLYKNYKGKKMLYPFNDLLDMPLNKYAVQLSLYQYLFEQCGFEIESRRIIWLLPNGTFKSIKTKNLTKRLYK